MADTAPAALGGSTPQRPPPARRGRLHRYGCAVLLAGLAALAQWLVQPWLGGRMPFVFVLPAVVLAAALWGRWPGMLVLGLGLGLGLGLMSSPPSLMLPGVHVLPGGPLLAPLLLLTAMGLLLVALGVRLRNLRQRACAAEARLVLAIEGTGMGVFELELASRRVHLSPGLARRMGLPAGPLPLERWQARMPPDVLARVEGELRQQLRQRARNYEQTLQLPLTDPGTAGVEWLLLRLQIDWHGSHAVLLRGVCLDITRPKRVETALAQARHALQQQVDDLDLLHQLSSRLLEDDGLEQQLGEIMQTLTRYHGSTRGLVALLEQGGTRLGLAAAQGLGEAALAQVGAAMAAPGAPALARQLGKRVVVEDTETAPAVERWRELARREGWRAVHCTPLISRGGAWLGTMAVLLGQPRQPTERECRLADICARKAVLVIERARAQAELAATKDRFQAVLESSAVPFTVLAPVRNPQGAITDFTWRYVNGAAALALGQPAHSLVNQPMRRSLQARTVPGGDLQPYIDVVEQGRARQFEIDLRLDGRAGWVQCIASPLHDEVAVWFTDITDRKRDERLLRDADRRKDEFLATLAHELRNPLAPIRQAAMLCKTPNVTEVQKRWCHEVIERQVQHLAALLDDLLDASRISRGVMALRRGDVWLASVIDAAIETVRPLIDARRHRLSLQLPPQPVQLHADPLRLSQVVGNLLSNAAEYTDEQGEIGLHCTLDETGLCITVTDNGIGIPAASLAQVFEMFTQLPPAGEQAQGGLGIGLALSRGMVALHGGSISVHSDGPGRGSSFSVHLPPGAVVRPPPAAATALRVLIADDNRDAAGSLALLLQIHGHDVHQSWDGEQAWAAYQRLLPQVCLLDIGMPVRDGYSLAGAIRSQGGRQPVLISITRAGQVPDRQRALAAGFNHHLTKPVDMTQLLQLVAQATR